MPRPWLGCARTSGPRRRSGPSRGRCFAQPFSVVTRARFYWYLRFHHLCNDGLGHAWVTEQVATEYTAHVGGRCVAPGRHVLWADVVAGELSYRSSQQFADDREFFRKHAVEPAGKLDSLGKYLLQQLAGKQCRATGHFPAALTERLRQFRKRSGVSLPRALLAVSALPSPSDRSSRHRLRSSVQRSDRAATATGGWHVCENSLPVRLHVDPAETFDGAWHGKRPEPYVTCCRISAAIPAERLRHDLGLLPSEPDVFETVVNIMPFNGHLDFGGCRARNHNLSNGPVRDLELAIYDYRDRSWLPHRSRWQSVAFFAGLPGWGTCNGSCRD